MEVKRLFDVPYHQLKSFPQSDALAGKVNGKWEKTTTQELVDQANRLSRGLLAMGLGPGDKVALISNNRPEWVISDIGILQIGAVDVPVYPTISESDYEYIFNDAEVKLCIVSDEELLGKVRAIEAKVPSLKGIYTYERIQGANHWTEILEKGNDADQPKVEALMAKVTEDDLATLIYTSGTTGKPKGVMLCHRNIVSNALASAKRLPVNEQAKAVSFLPVCHIYERMLLYLYMTTGVSIYFAESMDTIGDDIRDVQPDVFTAVPRLLEKVFERIMAKGEELTGVKRKLFFWAVALGEKYEPYGKNGWWYETKLKLARSLIFSKWQAALGGNTKAIASGSAALQPRLNRIFLAAGLPVMEGYGLTESSPVISVNEEANDGLRPGTCGRPLDGVEVKIAEDGEILARGPNIMMGYYNQPEKTAEVLSPDGWLHTGDIGTLVDGQYLKITDRKKEIFKTSGGKYVAPQVMENRFKESRFIEQIMVVGENKKHPAALVVPNFEFVKEWCERKGVAAVTNEEIADNPRVKERIWHEIQEINKDFGKFEQVKKIELCRADWSVETKELTPTLKLRRKIILEKYDDLMQIIYPS